MPDDALLPGSGEEDTAESAVRNMREARCVVPSREFYRQ